MFGGNTMSTVIQQVQKRMLVSLAQVARNLNIHEGDHVLLEERDGGIFISPVGWHEKNQEYFWSEEWQNMMKKSAEDLAQGRVQRFQDIKSLMEKLGGEEDDNA